MRKTYEFEGRLFPSLAEWVRAYPAYRSYEDLLRDHGPTTIQQLEKLILDRQTRGRAAALKAAKRSRFAAVHANLAIAGKERRRK